MNIGETARKVRLANYWIKSAKHWKKENDRQGVRTAGLWAAFNIAQLAGRDDIADRIAQRTIQHWQSTEGRAQ